jgi:hypothetical protein
VGVRGAARLVHDKKAECIWSVLAELEVAGLIALADKGYQGAARAKIPYGGKTSLRSGDRLKRSRKTAVTRRARERSAQDLAHPPQALLLPC